MFAATAAPSLYTLSYTYSINTAAFTGVASNGSSYFQIGTYINAGSGYGEQDFPNSGKEVQLSGAQLLSGSVFTGTVTIPFTAFSPPDSNVETFWRLGIIENGDVSNGGYFADFTDITIAPVPEPASLCGMGAIGSLLLMRRRVTA
jgi:hypothetical protein